MAWTMEEEALVVCSDKNQGIGITMWDLENGDRLLHLPTCASPPQGLICLRNHYLVASQVQRTGSVVSVGVIFMWSLNKHQATLRSYLMEATGPLSCTKDGIYLACGAASGNIYIWEVTSGRLLRKWFGHCKSVSCLVFSKDDSFLISGSEDGTMAVWSMIDLLDEKNSGQSPSIMSGSAEHKGAITGLLSTYGNSSSNLITSSLDGTCKIWNAVTGKLLGTQAFPLPITAIVLDHPFENILFSGADNGAIFVNNFDAGLAEPFPKPHGPQLVLNGHKKAVTALAFSRLGLISASDDCTVCLWDVANYAIIRRFGHFKGPISNLVVISKSCLFPSKNNQKSSTPFCVSLLDKYPHPPNLAKEIMTILPSTSSDPFDSPGKQDTKSCYRSTELLKSQIRDLETERTPEALEMKIESNVANGMRAVKMTKHTLKINNYLQCSYLDLLQAKLLQYNEED